MNGLDPNWHYKAHERGGGRTTRLMMTIADISADPQSIVMLFPRDHMALYGLYQLCSVLEAKGVDFDVRRTAEGSKVIEVSSGTRIEVLHWRVQPGRYVARANSLSIVMDHTCSPADDFWIEREPSRDDYRNMQAWEDAIAIIKAREANPESKMIERFLLLQ